MAGNRSQQARFNYSDDQGWNVLHYLCRRGNLRSVQIIVEQTCIDLNARTYSDNTALHIAAKNGYFDIVKYLVEQADAARDKMQIFTEEENTQRKRIDVTVLGLENETAAKAARDHGQDEIADYLDRHEKMANHWNNRNCILKLWL